MSKKRIFIEIWAEIRGLLVNDYGSVSFSRGGSEFKVSFGLDKCLLEHVGGEARLTFFPNGEYSTCLDPESYGPFVLEIHSLMFKEPLMD